MIVDLTGFPAETVASGQTLEKIGLDSLDVGELAIGLEDELLPDTAGELDIEPDWTVDKIADAVIAQLAKQEAAR
jgi:acyl carrier protein